MVEADAERLSDILSLGIAKLMDGQRTIPPLPPQFWIDLRYLIRDEARSFTPQDGGGK